MSEATVTAILQFGALGLLGGFMFFYIRSQEKRQATYDKHRNEESKAFIEFLFEITKTVALLNKEIENSTQFLQKHDSQIKGGQDKILDAIGRITS